MILAADRKLSVSLRFYPEYDLLSFTEACANCGGGVVHFPVLSPPRSCEIPPSVSQCKREGELEEALWAVGKSADACLLSYLLTWHPSTGEPSWAGSQAGVSLFGALL